MKVLFIYPEINCHSYSYHFGVGYLSAVLKEEGIEVELLHFTNLPSKETVVKNIDGIKPDLVGVSVVENQFIYVKKIIKWIKSGKLSPLVVCGGVFSILSPKEVLEKTSSDMVCTGEGEKVMLELTKRISREEDIEDVKGLWINKNNKVIKNANPPLIKDLDSLPYPDRDIFEYEKILKFFNNTAAFMITRGCPFNCSYCCNESLKEALGYRKIRFRSVNNILGEIEKVIRKYENVNYIFFDDDTFTYNENYMKKFLKQYYKQIGLPYAIQSRVEIVNEDIFQFLQQYGCDRIGFGVESGSERIRKQLLNRGMNNYEIKKAFDLADEYNIKTFSNNMLGFPTESQKDIEKTLKLNQEINPSNGVIAFFYPYRGTKLYNYCKENSLLSDKFISSYFTPTTVLKNLNLSNRELEKYFYEFKYLFMILNWRNKYKILNWIFVPFTVIVDYLQLRALLGKLKCKFDQWYVKYRRNKLKV